MKDKRQRMSMTWPFHVAYSDPALAATLLAAAGSLPHIPYPPIPTTLPATAHLAPSASPFSAYYRYPPGYHASGGPVHVLHRPPRPNPYLPGPLIPHPSMPTIHMLGMSSGPVTSFNPTPLNNPTTTTTSSVTYPRREELSPGNSDTSSSECDHVSCVNVNQLPHLHPASLHAAPQPAHTHHSHYLPRVNAPATVTSASLMAQRDRLAISSGGETSQQVRLNGMSVPVVTVLPFENNASSSYNHVAVPPTSRVSTSPPSSLIKPDEQEQQQQQPQQPKLFQPYKNDPPEDKTDQNGAM